MKNIKQIMSAIFLIAYIYLLYINILILTNIKMKQFFF